MSFDTNGSMMSNSNGNDNSIGDPPSEVNYRDYSLVAPPDCYGMIADQGNAATQTFPRKLHYLLTYADEMDDGLSQIISWRPHGRCFVVHDAKKFTSQVLPNWFMQNKLASFQRQLNLYSFKRFTTGPDKGGYYHELFLRGRPDLVLHVKRTKVKGEGHRKAAAPDSEPDFYREFPLHENKASGTTPALIPSTSSLLVPALSMNVPLAPPVPPLHHPQESISQQLHLFNSQNIQQGAEVSTLDNPMASVTGSAVHALSQQDDTPDVPPHHHLGPLSEVNPELIVPYCNSPMPPGNGNSLPVLPSTRPQDGTTEETPQKDLDQSMLQLGQQQNLFYQNASPQTLASNLMFHNNDMITEALQAAAPFYHQS